MAIISLSGSVDAAYNPKVTKSFSISQKDVIYASKMVKDYTVKNKKLPNHVSVKNYKITMPQFLYMVSKTTEYKISKKTSNIKIKYNFKNPSSVSTNSIKGKANYKSLKWGANKVSTYMNKNKKAPNYLTTPYGKVKYQSLIYIFSSYLSQVYTTKKVPSYLYVNIKSSNPINKYMPNIRYSGGVIANINSDNNINNNNAENSYNSLSKNAIWVFGSNMKKVDLKSLKSYNIGNIFLNYYAFEEYGESTVKKWIDTAKSYDIKVHIWIQVFYSNNKWINPVIDKNTGEINQTYFNKVINKAKEYIYSSGADGIHMDYLRYPGTAFKTTGASEAISEFTRQMNIAIKSINKNLILSATVMPETSSNDKYYGQNISQMGKYLDFIIPMVYKGNYEKGTSWIKSTVSWFVRNSGGAKIITGIQTYQSDNKAIPLSIAELTNDCKVAIAGGSYGIALFRYGLVNLFNLNNAYK
ncbi:MAG: hypothetical protein LBM96_04725 [Methanobrevibacter sp.]|nr:hypothetical protein [Candidatus Methanoflexus mossambicus]